jgi:hypothetical protein
MSAAGWKKSPQGSVILRDDDGQISITEFLHHDVEDKCTTGIFHGEERG